MEDFPTPASPRNIILNLALNDLIIKIILLPPLLFRINYYFTFKIKYEFIIKNISK